MNIISSVVDYPRNLTPDEIIRLGYVLTGDALEMFYQAKEDEIYELECRIDALEQENESIENMRDYDRAKYEELKDDFNELEYKVHVREEKLQQLVNIGSWK